MPRARTLPGRAAAALPEPATLALEPPADGRTHAEMLANLAVEGLVSNAFTTVKASSGTFGPLDLTACLKALTESAGAVNRGDLKGCEALLAAQAATLNAMFTTLVDRAFKADFVEAYERNMRYGLRAQAQCRATLETLAAIKNPPTVFAKQANIANGPQQVNNVAQVPEGSRVRAISGSAPTELLEAHVERVDSGTQGAAVGGDQAMEALGVVNRPAKRRR